ncbi:tRNA-dependent cyclodipeptide synthase [Streptomyces sp. NPDC057654]|uniref:tRNA-dependent cyclodipeptide synthase n=1 Tax=Streptomyces sp. NPDC057654 TaxID=3346196 RepID=UPI00369213A2
MSFYLDCYTERCRRIADTAEHALIGVSPFNGHYKPKVVEALVEGALESFEKVDVLTPGYEAAYTLTAGGMTPPEAAHRVRKATKQLLNPARRALLRAGVTEPDRHLHTWTQLANRPAYTRLRHQVRKAYETDPAVRTACRAVTRDAVAAVSEGEPDEQQIDIGVDYPMAEMPLFIDTPSVFGVDSSVFVYHRRIQIAEVLLSGAPHDLELAPGQGFAVATPLAAPAPNAHASSRES